MPHRGVSLEPLASQRDWDDACAALPGATAFHRYDFLELVAPSVRCRFVPLQVVVKGQIAGIAPLMVKRLGPACTINWVPFPYLGPLVPSALLPATLSALRREGRRRRAIAHQQSFPHLIADGLDSDFAATSARTFVISLSGRSDADLLSAMQKKRREELRRAERAGYEVRSAERQDFRQVDDWIGQMYATQGIRDTYRRGTCERVFAALGERPGSLFHAARLGGQTVGMAATLWAGQSAFGWQVAIDPAHRSRHPQAVLTWSALRSARDAGLAEFDLVGSPSEGIAAYKRRFGAVERHYTVLCAQAAVRRAALTMLARKARSAARTAQ
jgi:CelD/BcsL family acetyltransferase involved in cellulose biosynthesis